MAYQPSVVLVDAHDLVRAGVRSELGERVRVVGEAGDVPDAVEVIVDRRPDVVLLDVHLPSGTGADVIRGVLASGGTSCFLALSVSDAPDDVISVIRAGARGYVTKAIKGPELVDAIIRVAEGDAVFSPRLAGFVLDAFSAAVPEPDDPELDLLSPREQEVLRLLARGYAYKEIARELYVSINTVRTHCRAIYRKLGVGDRHRLVEKFLHECPRGRVEHLPHRRIGERRDRIHRGVHDRLRPDAPLDVRIELGLERRRGQHRGDRAAGGVLRNGYLREVFGGTRGHL